MAEKLIDYIYDLFFEEDEMQRDLKTIFDDEDKKDLVNEAVKWITGKASASKAKKYTPEGIKKLKNTTETYLPDGIEDKTISKNIKLKIMELEDVFRSASSKGQGRVNKRVDKLIDEESGKELVKLPPSKIFQEKINKKISEDILSFSREEFLSPNVGVANRSLRSVANQVKVSESSLQSALEREGFAVVDGKIRRKIRK